jgi:hypothetical protein
MGDCMRALVSDGIFYAFLVKQLPQSTVPIDIDETSIPTLSPLPAFFFELECCI